MSSGAFTDCITFPRYAPVASITGSTNDVAYLFTGLKEMKRCLEMIFRIMAVPPLEGRHELALRMLIFHTDLFVQTTLADSDVVNGLNLRDNMKRGSYDAEDIQSVVTEFAHLWNRSMLSDIFDTQRPLHTWLGAGFEDTLLRSAGSLANAVEDYSVEDFGIDLPVTRTLRRRLVESTGFSSFIAIVAVVIGAINLGIMLMDLEDDELLRNAVVAALGLLMAAVIFLSVSLSVRGKQAMKRLSQIPWASPASGRSNELLSPPSAPLNSLLPVVRTEDSTHSSIVEMSPSNPLLGTNRSMDTLPSMRGNSITTHHSSEQLQLAIPHTLAVLFMPQGHSGEVRVKLGVKTFTDAVGVVIVMDSRVIYWGDSVSDATGVPAVDAIGMKVTSLLDYYAATQYLSWSRASKKKRPKRLKLSFLTPSAATSVSMDATVSNGTIGLTEAKGVLAFVGHVIREVPHLEPLAAAFRELVLDTWQLRGLWSSTATQMSTQLSTSQFSTTQTFPSINSHNSHVGLSGVRYSMAGQDDLIFRANPESVSTESLNALLKMSSRGWDIPINTLRPNELLAKLGGSECALIDLVLGTPQHMNFIMTCDVQALESLVEILVQRISLPHNGLSVQRPTMTLKRVNITDSSSEETPQLPAGLSIAFSTVREDVSFIQMLEIASVKDAIDRSCIVINATESSIELAFPVYVPSLWVPSKKREIAHSTSIERSGSFADIQQSDIENDTNASDSQSDSSADLGHTGGFFVMAGLTKSNLRVLVYEPNLVLQRHLVDALTAEGHTPVVLEASEKVDTRAAQLLQFRVADIDIAMVDDVTPKGEQLLSVIQRLTRVGTVQLRAAGRALRDNVNGSAVCTTALPLPASTRSITNAIRQAFEATKSHPTSSELRKSFLTADATGARNTRSEKELGKGAQGTVYKILQDTTRIEAALKSVTVSNPERCDVLEQTLAELCSLQHPNVLQYYCIKRQRLENDKSCLNIFMEYCSGGTLRDHLNKMQKRSSTDPVEVALIVWQILCGLQHLHEEGKIAHRDLKPENILVWNSSRTPHKDGPPDELRVPCGTLKIADYGIGARDRETLGTPRYMSPDAVKASTDTAVDIWAVGVMTLELFNELPPILANATQISVTNFSDRYKSFESASFNAASLPFDVNTKRLPAPALTFVQQCLQINPRWRPSARSLQFHPFIADTLRTVAASKPAGRERPPTSLSITNSVSRPLVAGSGWTAFTAGSTPEPSVQSPENSRTTMIQIPHDDSVTGPGGHRFSY